MKKLILLLYSVIFIPLTAGCWNYKEVDKMTIVTGFAVDKTARGNYLLTFEIVDFIHSTEGQTIKSAILESEGESLFGAARNSQMKNAPKLYFGHSTAAIFSREVASEGISKVLDFFLRDAEPRLSINLYVSEEETAGEIFKAKPMTSELVSVELANLMEEQKNLSKALDVPAYKFVNAVVEDGIAGVMTSVSITENNGEKVIQSCGTAVFKEDKLIGFIDAEDTFYLSFVTGEVKGGFFIVDVPDKDSGKLTLDIIGNRTRMKPVFEDGELSVSIKIDTKTALIEHNSVNNYNDKKGRDALVKMAGEQLKSKIEGIISKVQKEYGTDIFGFGNLFYREVPKVWKEKGKDWDNIFRNLKVSVETEIELKHTSLLTEPVKIGD